jgi:hypothetical protein
LTIVGIVAMLSIISTIIISQVSAAPKKGYYNSHNKITVNSETDEVSFKDVQFQWT